MALFHLTTIFVNMKTLLCILTFLVWMTKCKADFDPSKFDYCKQCKPETKNPNTGEHPACRCDHESDRIEIFGDDTEEMVKIRELILDIHNEFRNHIASGNETRIDAKFAADMMAVNWDVELEYYARCRAMGSLLNKKYGSEFVPHEGCRTTQNKGSYGQNLASSSWDEAGKKPDHKMIADLVRMWYDSEVPKVKMTPTYFQKFVGVHGTGHFTQIIWSRANRLGCVVVRIDPKNSVNPDAVLNILCDYYSDIVKYGGNMLDDYIYKQVDSKDKTCTECYKGTSCDKSSKYPFLCGKVESVPKETVPVGSSDKRKAGKIMVVTMILVTIFLQ